MKKILFIFLIFTSLINAQSDLQYPGITVVDIPGAIIVQAKYFEGGALWGHINGGADLYLEYGFNRLLFQEILFKEINFRVEIYIMNDPEAAFGVYSINHYKCGEIDTLLKFTCITQYQLQSAVDKFYISIANDKGTKEAQEISKQLFSIILSKTSGETIVFPELFKHPSIQNKLNEIKFFRGLLGLQNGFPQWLDLFDSLNNYEIYLLPTETRNQFMNFSYIKFESPQSAVKFLENCGTNFDAAKDNYVIELKLSKRLIKFIGTSEVIFIETDILKTDFDIID